MTVVDIAAAYAAHGTCLLAQLSEQQLPADLGIVDCRGLRSYFKLEAPVQADLIHTAAGCNGQ